MPYMSAMHSLISFVGNRDPYPDSGDDAEEPGPLLSLLLAREREGEGFDEAYLLCTGGAFLERARDLEREAREEGLRTRILAVDLPLRDVIDYVEIWGQLERVLPEIRERAGPAGRRWSFLLDSGTPQAKGCLLLAARSGLFPATLIQGIPPRFAGGTYKAREVRLDGLPEAVLSRAPRPTSGRGAPSAGREGALDRDCASAAFLAAESQALRAAKYRDPILLLGETGTGKTRIARAVHEASGRKGGPFIEVNCSAIPESLAESELFGHVRGAFSGADRNRAGKFRAAEGGTLFLDEIGELPAELQAKLLKALDEGLVTPVGSDEAQRCDARVIAATNRDLGALVREGRFRQDLHERLKVFVVRLPPLRERPEDIPYLAARFVEDWNAQYDERRYLTDEALAALRAYSWPGNVRELINCIKSACCTAAGSALGLDSLPEQLRAALAKPAGAEASAGGSSAARAAGSGAPQGGPCLEPGLGSDGALPPGGVNLRAKLLQVEWGYVAAALRASGGNREAAAKLLGLTGHALRKALKERLAAFDDGGGEEGTLGD